MPNDINFSGEENDQDDDLLADLLAEEMPAGDNESQVSQEDVSALKTQVEELTKANTGLLKAKQAETQKRQESAQRLSQLEGAVGTILSQRQQQGTESVTEQQAADARGMGIPVTYDEDGNGWIDPSFVQNMVSPYQREINDLKAQLQHTNAAATALTEAERIKQSIIGEDERFGPAGGRYRAARRWVESAVTDYAKANGITGRNIQSGEALDKVFDANLRAEFNQEYPGLNLLSIVTAEDSQEQFRMALDGIANVMKPDLESPKEKMDSRFQKVLEKPSNLGNHANAKAGQLSIMDKIDSFSSNDIMDLSDAQVEALLKLAEKG
jgi:hypothetical protein